MSYLSSNQLKQYEGNYLKIKKQENDNLQEIFYKGSSKNELTSL